MDRRTGTKHSFSLWTSNFDVDDLLCGARTKQKTCQCSGTRSWKWLIYHLTILSTLQIFNNALNGNWSSSLSKYMFDFIHFLEHCPICQTWQWWPVLIQVIFAGSVLRPVPTKTEFLYCNKIHQGQPLSNSVSYSSTERARICNNRQMMWNRNKQPVPTKTRQQSL